MKEANFGSLPTTNQPIPSAARTSNILPIFDFHIPPILAHTPLFSKWCQIKNHPEMGGF